MWQLYKKTHTITGGTKLIHSAARCGHSDLVEYLVEQQGSDVNAKDDDGWTPLHHATYINYKLDTVKALVSLGADIHAKVSVSKCQARSTPLHLAAGSNRHPDMVKTLVSFGADIHAKTKLNEKTPLHIAGEHGNLETVKELLSFGADIHARTKNGLTTLHLTASEGDFAYSHVQTIRELVSQGADVNAKTK